MNNLLATSTLHVAFASATWSQQRDTNALVQARQLIEAEERKYITAEKNSSLRPQK